MSKVKFGTGGFRAIIGEDFNKENVQTICQAISNIIIRKNLKKTICIGYDNRFMSEIFAKWCSEVFAGNDINVELFDRATSTPVCMFASKLNQNDYGMMITASHNPYQYNGVKVFVQNGKDASIEETKEIENEFDKVEKIISINYDKAIGKKIILKNYEQEYINNIFKVLEIDSTFSDLTVVFDSKYGSTANEIQSFSKQLGIQNYQIINGNRDAFFNFTTPAPSIDNISELRENVLSLKADIGFALDADGDRLAVIDEKGNYIDNNFILAISYYFLVKYCGKKGDSVKNTATSNLLEVVTSKFGYTCREVPVGFKYVSSALKEYDAVIGGESSGGLAVKGHILGKDSLLAIALCLKAMATMKKPFSEILKEVLVFADNYSKKILDKQYSYTIEEKEFINKTLFEDKLLPLQRYEIKDIVYKDYLKIFYKNENWVLIRFSGTEPILRIFAEADTKEETSQLILDWENLLNLKQ